MWERKNEEKFPMPRNLLKFTVDKGKQELWNIVTFALGFSVDFSEDNEPTDELGDNPGPPEAEATAPHSEVDDAELLGRTRELADCAVPCDFKDLDTSDGSVEELIFSWALDEGRAGA